MEAFSTRRIVCVGLTAAIYVVLTAALPEISYSAIQFRIAESLMLFCLLDKDFVIATTLGCFTANLFSSVGALDVIVGTSATLLSGLCIYIMRDKLNPLSASVFPVVFNAVFVGTELFFVSDTPLEFGVMTVAAGEIVCVTILGTIFYKAVTSNAAIMKIITDNVTERQPHDKRDKRDKKE